MTKKCFSSIFTWSTNKHFSRSLFVTTHLLDSFFFFFLMIFSISIFLNKEILTSQFNFFEQKDIDVVENLHRHENLHRYNFVEWIKIWRLAIWMKMSQFYDNHANQILTLSSISSANIRFSSRIHLMYIVRAKLIFVVIKQCFYLLHLIVSRLRSLNRIERVFDFVFLNLKKLFCNRQNNCV